MKCHACLQPWRSGGRNGAIHGASWLLRNQTRELEVPVRGSDAMCKANFRQLRPPHTCTHTCASAENENTHTLKNKISKIKGWDEKVPFLWPAPEPPSEHHTWIAELTDQSHGTGRSILYKVSDELILTFPDNPQVWETQSQTLIAHSNRWESLKKCQVCGTPATTPESLEPKHQHPFLKSCSDNSDME